MVAGVYGWSGEMFVKGYNISVRMNKLWSLFYSMLTIINNNTLRPKRLSRERLLNIILSQNMCDIMQMLIIFRHFMMHTDTKA